MSATSTPIDRPVGLHEGAWAYLGLGSLADDQRRPFVEACESSGWPAVSWPSVPDRERDPERFFEAVGRGILPWPLILGEADRAGVEWYIVEQDVCRRDPLESVRLSYEYLTGLSHPGVGNEA